MSGKPLLKRKIFKSDKNDKFEINETVIVWYVNSPLRFGKVIAKSKIDNTIYVKTKIPNSYTIINWVNKSRIRKFTFL